MSNVDWDAIDEFIKEADKDDRMGDHDATLMGVTEGSWPSGDKFTEWELRLDSTRGQAKVNCALGKPMGPAELKAVAADKARGVALGQRLLRDLHKLYGVDDPAAGKVGMRLRVKIGPRKAKGYDKPFPMVVAFKPAEEIGKKAETTASGDVPF